MGDDQVSNDEEMNSNTEANNNEGINVEMYIQEEEENTNLVEQIEQDTLPQNHIGAPSFNEFSNIRVSTIKRELADDSDDTQLRNAAILIAAKSLIQSHKQQQEDEWDALGKLVAGKIRNLKNPMLQLKAESAIHNILMEIRAEDAGYSVVPITKSVS